MVYKIINEWKSEDGSEHELIVYRYNYSQDCKTTYLVQNDMLEIKMHAQGLLFAHSTQQLEAE